MNNSYVLAVDNRTRFAPSLLVFLKPPPEKKEAAEIIVHSWKLPINYPQYLNSLYCYIHQRGMIKFLEDEKKCKNVNGIS